MYRFLGSSLDKLVENQNEFPIVGSFRFSESKQKLAYPYDDFILQNMHQHLNLTKETYWSTLTQSFACDKIIESILLQADVFENFVQKGIETYTISSLYSYSRPGYTWKVGLKLTKIVIDHIKDKHCFRKNCSTTYAIVSFFSPDLFMKISNFSKTVRTLFLKI